MNKTVDIEKLKYPIGKFEKPEEITSDQIENWISEISVFPSRMVEVVKDLSDVRLDWNYRPEGWTIRQVIHHCADSHMNAFIRFKLCLTEDTPTIKPYLQDKWAELPDGSGSTITDSLKILEGLHSRWTLLLKLLNTDDLKREFQHPEYNKKISVAENISLYAWHCNHHLAHIKQALHYKGEF